MYLRYKGLVSDQEQVKCIEVPGSLRYKFWKKDGLVCDVRRKKDVEFILYRRQLNGNIVEFEVAYNRYGVFFNEDGFEIQRESTSSLPQPQSTVTISEAVVNRKLTPLERVKRMQEGRNRKRIERGDRPIDFNA